MKLNIGPGFSAVAALALTLSAPPLWAQSQAPAPPSQQQPQAMSAQGELLRVDLEKKQFWIEDASGKEVQFRFTEATEVTGQVKNIEGLATKTGTRVAVQYRAEGGGAVATKIDIQASAADGAKPEPRPQP
jgi:hypothetical protein